MLRSIGKQSGESVESVRKKKRKATVERICRKRQLKAWKACTDPDVKRSNDGMELALVCVYVCVCVCEAWICMSIRPRIFPRCSAMYLKRNSVRRALFYIGQQPYKLGNVRRKNVASRRAEVCRKSANVRRRVHYEHSLKT